MQGLTCNTHMKRRDTSCVRVTLDIMGRASVENWYRMTCNTHMKRRDTSCVRVTFVIMGRASDENWYRMIIRLGIYILALSYIRFSSFGSINHLITWIKLAEAHSCICPYDFSFLTINKIWQNGRPQ